MAGLHQNILKAGGERTSKKRLTVLWMILATACTMPVFQLFPVEVNPAHIPVDLPYHWFQNYAWANDFGLLRQTHFPHGMLGALQYWWPFSGLYVFGWGLVFFQRLFLAYLIFKLLSELKNKWIVSVIAMFCMVSLRLADGLVLQALLLFIVYSETKEKRWIIFLLITAIIGYYIRLLPMLMATSLMIGAVLLHIYNTRRMEVLWHIVALPAGIIGLWLMMGGTMTGFWIHQTIMVELFKGSPFATALYPQNNIWFLLISFFCLAWVIIKNTKGLTPLILAGAWFLLFKYAFVREGYAHVQVYSATIISTGFLLAVKSTRYRIINIALIVVAMFSFWANMYQVTRNFWPRFSNVKAIVSWPHYLSQSKAEKYWQRKVEKVTEYCKWPEAAWKVGDAKAAVFPYNYIYPIVNNNSIAPTPITQSYVAYTPYLDSLQADFFSKKNAPAYLYLHDGFGIHQHLSIDYQYYHNVAPRTQAAIHKNYSKVASRDDVSLWKKAEHPISNSILRLKGVTLNEWKEVPPYQGSEVYLSAEMQLTIAGKVQNFLYKPPHLEIIYQLTDGSEYRFNLNMLNLSYGVLAQPFYMNASKTDRVEVRRLKIVCDQPALLVE